MSRTNNADTVRLAHSLTRHSHTCTYTLVRDRDRIGENGSDGIVSVCAPTPTDIITKSSYVVFSSMRRPNGKRNRENMITSAATESKNNLPYFGCVCVCVVVAAVCEPIRGRCFSGYNETIARGCVCASVPEVKFVDINRSRSEHNLCESMFSGRG